MKRPSIPAVPRGQDGREAFDSAVKQNLEILSGVRGTKIDKLSTSATTPEIVAKINEILSLMQ